MKALISQQGAADRASFMARLAETVGIVAKPMLIVPGTNEASFEK